MESQKTRANAGNRKKTTPIISIIICARLGSICETTSTLTCSFLRKVYPEANKNIAPNRYHCNSSQALELICNNLRDTALVALTTTTISVNHIMYRPISLFRPSITRDIFSKKFISVSKECMHFDSTLLSLLVHLVKALTNTVNITLLCQSVHIVNSMSLN